jgi:hypothetical protein
VPTYKHGGKTFRRKNLYLPCIIGPRLDDMSDEEVADVYKATYWADNIAASEWPAVLRHDDCSPSAKSRLKKKAAGWIMALERIGRIKPAVAIRDRREGRRDVPGADRGGAAGRARVGRLAARPRCRPSATRRRGGQRRCMTGTEHRSALVTGLTGSQKDSRTTPKKSK